MYDEVKFRENEQELKRYVEEILKGLVLLHSNGIIHNDMKPVSTVGALYSNFDSHPIDKRNKSGHEKFIYEKAVIFSF